MPACAECHTTFSPTKHSRQRYCTPQCWTVAHNRRRRAKQPQEYRARLEVLAGRPRPDRCDACGLKPDPAQRHRSLSYDHNHGTGAFRGWLCHLCNRAIGLAGDNPRILESLVVYLQLTSYAPTRPVFS